MRRIGLGSRLPGEWQDDTRRGAQEVPDEAAIDHRLASQFPLLNLLESEKAFAVIVELPGIKKGDVELLVTDESITLSGERVRTAQDPEENYRRLERWHGHWSRQLFLPSRIIADEVHAEMGNGILTIHLPKARRSKARRVAVEDVSSEASHV